MEFVRHEARLRQLDEKGVSARAHLEGLVTRAELAHGAGSPQHEAALAQIDGPPLPETVEHLWGWAVELHGRSGIGTSGLAPLSYGTIADWARLTDREPKPHEIEALLHIDAVLLTGGKA